MHESPLLSPTAFLRVDRDTYRPLSGLRWTFAEFWLPIVVIFIFCMAVSADYGYAAAGGTELYMPLTQSNVVRQLAFLGLGAFGLYWLTLARPAASNGNPAWTILLPTLLVSSYLLASIFWSDDAVMTLKRSITACIVIVAGLGLGRIWSVRDLAWAIVILSSLFLLCCILIELKYRAFLTNDDYRFSGFFHPAKLAFSCGFLAIASLVIYFVEGRKWMLLVVATAFVFLVLTKARTGTAATLIACAWLTCYYTSLRGWLLVGAASGLAALAALLFYIGTTGKELNIVRVTTMGRDEAAADPTKLTGRLPIWSHAFNLFTQRPVLGYGYGAFWTPGRLAEFEQRNGWALSHSHSTYLESLLNLGLVGCALGSVVLITVAYRSVTLSRRRDRSAMMIAGILLMAAIGGFSEIAFIGLEYESLIAMIGIGAITFAASSPSLGRKL